VVVESLWIFITSFVGTLGFAALVHAPGRAWAPAGAIGGASYTLYWLLMHLGVSEGAAIFAGALAGSLLAQWCARRMRMIATIFIMLSIVSLVPGLGLYRFMELLGQGQNAQGLRVGVNAMIDIVMIALGIGVGSFLFRMAAGRKNAASKA